MGSSTTWNIYSCLIRHATYRNLWDFRRHSHPKNLYVPQTFAIYQLIPQKHHQHQMARRHFQQRPLGHDWSKPHWDQKKEMGVDRPHTQEVPLKRHQASPWLESTRKAKSRKTETDLAQEYWRRGEGHRNDMGTAEEDLTEPSALEECCCGSMFLRELKGLSSILKYF